MAAKPYITDLSAARLREFLHYDPETGFFFWRVNRTRGVKAGDRAGSLESNTQRSYEQISIEDRAYKSHRLAWLYMTGEWPDRDIDHKDTDGLNNKWENLRLATKSQNIANARLSVLNKTGFKGVHKRRGRYQANISIDGKKKVLGTFDTPEEAHRAYSRAAIDLYGEFARLA